MFFLGKTVGSNYSFGGILHVTSMATIFFIFIFYFFLEHTKASSLHSCGCLGLLAAIFFSAIRLVELRYGFLALALTRVSVLLVIKILYSDQRCVAYDYSLWLDTLSPRTLSTASSVS